MQDDVFVKELKALKLDEPARKLVAADNMATSLRAIDRWLEGKNLPMLEYRATVLEVLKKKLQPLE